MKVGDPAFWNNVVIGVVTGVTTGIVLYVLLPHAINSILQAQRSVSAEVSEVSPCGCTEKVASEDLR